MPPRIVHDGPDDHCFGCGHANERGLHLEFEHEPGGETRARYVAPGHLRGPPGVVHGGIQATLLDEVLGIAIHEDQRGDGPHFATVDFRLSYLGPVPTGVALTIAGRVTRAEGRDVWAEGEIRDETDRVLTRAEARWRRLRASRDAGP